MLHKEFMDELAHRCFFSIKYQLFMLPFVAKGSFTAQRLAELGPDSHRGFYPRADLRTFPFGHARDKRIEKSASRR